MLLLGNESYGFGNQGLVWYDLMSELVSNINEYGLIGTDVVI